MVALRPATTNLQHPTIVTTLHRHSACQPFITITVSSAPHPFKLSNRTLTPLLPTMTQQGCAYLLLLCEARPRWAQHVTQRL